MYRTLRSLLVLVSLLTGIAASAQHYTWQEHPKLHKIPDSYAKESAVYLLEKRLVRYVPNEKKDIDVYRTVHAIIRLIDDKGVEYFNKWTVGTIPGARIEEVRGRTIKANGKVIDLARDQIRTNDDENGQLQYHLAFEGVEKGDEVEIFYTEKRPFALFGSETLQHSLPVVEAKFQLEVPDVLRFDNKGYNGFPNAKDTVIDETRYYRTEQSNLDAMEEEQYSDVVPNLKRIEYKLSYSGDSNVRLYTWNDLAKRMYELYYTFSDKEQKALQKFMEPMALDKLGSEEEKIKRIESVIKQEIVLGEKISDDDADKLTYVLEKKTAEETGMVRLFTACLTAAGIQHELGIASNRFEYPLDEKFENWNRPDIYVLYFPATQKYLCPAASTLRYPFIIAAVRENKAIFCKRTTVGNLTSALASIRSIPASPYEENSNILKAEVSFDKESMTPLIKMTHGFTGYAALSYREAVTFLPKDKEKELVQGIVSGIADQPEDIVSYSFANKGLEHYSDNLPVEIHSEIRADQLMETAGGKWLFKVGDLLGPQTEMYKDKERKLPISMPFAHSYIRDIIVDIPEGYKISNPESVKIDIKGKENSLGFISDYTMQGRKMLIHVKEFYARDTYPASDIEAFRKVINAAADFNKVTLVLEKE